LFDINKELWKRKDADMDVLELVPLEVMQNDREFFDYIYNSNNLIGKNQIVGLMKIAAFCKDPELNEKKQSEIRKQCLKLWKLPDESRKKPITKSSEQVCGQLLQAKWAKEKFLNAPEKPLDSMKAVEHHIKSTLDWYFVGIDVIRTCNTRTFFMSRGRFDVLAYNMTTDVWDRVNDIEMSADTLIYGEIVKELIGESRSQISAQALHIIDGIVLGGKDIRHLPLVERNQMCRKFARALTKPPQCENKSMPIRCKKLFKLTDIENFFDHLIPRRLKDGSEKMGYDIARTNNLNTNRFHIPRGLLLLDEVRSDKTRCFSNTHKKFYFFDKLTGKTFFSEFLKHDEKYASFKNTFMYRIVWKFEVREQILEYVEQERKLPEHLYRGDFVQFVNTKTPKINW
jgi:cap1 methyltransferase